MLDIINNGQVIFRQRAGSLRQQLQDELGQNLAWSKGRERSYWVNKGTAYIAKDKINRGEPVSRLGSFRIREPSEASSSVLESESSKETIETGNDDPKTETSEAGNDDPKTETSDYFLRTAREMELPSELTLGGSIAINDDGKAVLRNTGQFVVDPVSGDLFLVREILYGSDGELFGSGLKDLKSLGLEIRDLLPITHPYSGRKFDVLAFKEGGLAKFKDPGCCVAFVQQSLCETKVHPSREYLWSHSDIIRSSMALSKVPWLILENGETIVIDDFTQQPYVLSKSSYCRHNHHPYEYQRMLTSPITGEQFVRLDEGIAYSPIRYNYWDMTHAINHKYKKLQLTSYRRGESRTIVDTESWIQENINSEDEKKRNFAEAIYRSYQNITVMNYENEMGIRSRCQYEIMPESLLVMERISSGIYSANPVRVLTESSIYTKKDIAMALEFARGRKFSIRDGSDDHSYEVKISSDE